MPIADLVYNSDYPYGGTGVHTTTDGTSTNNEKVYIVMPPPPDKFPLYPYPPYPHPPYPPFPPCPPHRPDDGEYPGPDAKQSEVEKKIAKLAGKSASLRALIANIEDKNKPVLIKSGANSFNLGEYKIPDPEDPELTIEDENIASILEILKAELEKIKAEIKELSDEISVDD